MNIEFTIDTDNIAEVAEILSSNDIQNSITGTTEDGHVLLKVKCTKENRDAVDEIEELSISEDE